MPHSETYIDGVWYPSVTTIINSKPKPWLDEWKQKWGPLAERKTAIANKIGTEFHKCIEQWFDTGTFSISENFSPVCAVRVIGMMESFIDWAINVDGIISATELKVISEMYTYSGTLDAVGTLNGKPILFDWKTSSRIYDDMDLQLVAYAQAYKEQTGKDIGQGIIVQVSKDKPHFIVSTKIFKLGKRVLNKFLKLRKEFS